MIEILSLLQKCSGLFSCVRAFRDMEKSDALVLIQQNTLFGTLVYFLSSVLHDANVNFCFNTSYF